MSEYEQSITVSRAPEKVFSVAADIERLPGYLPVFTRVEKLAGGESVRAQGNLMGHGFNQTGFFRIDRELRRIEFGSEGVDFFRGWLRVLQGPDVSASDVTVHVSFNVAPEQEQWLRSRFSDLDSMIQSALKSALEAFRNHCEGHGDPVNEADAAAPA